MKVKFILHKQYMSINLVLNSVLIESINKYFDSPIYLHQSEANGEYR